MSNRAALLDALERIFWTSLQAFTGALLASPVFDSLGIGWQDALKIAAFAAGLSIVKQVFAIASTHNGTPQLGVNTYDNNPEGAVSVDSPGGIGRNG